MNFSFIKPCVTFPSCNIYRLVTGQMASNCYLVADKETDGIIIIDSGDDAEYIIDTVIRFRAIPRAIVATHGHFDHVLGGFAVQQTFDVPFYLNPKDKFLLDRMQGSARHFLGVRHADPPPIVTNDLLEGTEIRLGKNVLRSFASPGHTPGSMSISLEGYRMLFVGDVMFAGGGTGSTDHSYSERSILIASIQRICSLPLDTVILPGHGEATTVQRERKYNNVLSL